MATGRGAGDAEVIRIDVIIFGMITDKAHGALDIFDDFRDRKFWLRAVNNSKDGVTMPQEGSIHFRTDSARMRTPAAADDKDDAQTIGLFLGSNHIHRQSQAGLTAIDHVTSANR